MPRLAMQFGHRDSSLPEAKELRRPTAAKLRQVPPRRRASAAPRVRMLFHQCAWPPEGRFAPRMRRPGYGGAARGRAQPALYANRNRRIAPSGAPTLPQIISEEPPVTAEN